MFECDVDIESLLYRQSLFWGLVIDAVVDSEQTTRQ